MNRSTAIAIILLVSLVFGVFAAWPKYKEFKLKGAEVVQKEAELRREKDYAAQIERLSQELGKHSAEMEKIDAALPSGYFLLSFLNYLQKTSSENGLNLTSYKYSSPGSESGAGAEQKEAGKTTGGNGLKEMYFDLNLSGFYSSFLNLLSAFERSSKLIEIQKTSFAASDDATKPWDFNLTIKVYRY